MGNGDYLSHCRLPNIRVAWYSHARWPPPRAAGAKNMIIHCDSQVITSQINGDYECRNERMKKYLEEVKSRISGLEVKFVQIPWEENECADCLAKTASAEFMNASE